MAGSDKGRGKRFSVRRLQLILVVIAVLTGLAALYIVTGRRQLERRLAVLRAAGYPTSPAELAEYTRLPEGVTNAAETYLRAMAAFVPPADQVSLPHITWNKPAHRGLPLPQPVVEANAEFLAGNRQCLSLLREAASIEYCQYGRDPQNSVPSLMSVVSCARLLALHAISQTHAGDPDGAIASIRDILRLGDSLSREPTMIKSFFARTACYLPAIRAMEEALCSAGFTDEQLSNLGDTLAAIGGSIDLGQAIGAEGYGAIEYFMHPSGEYLRPASGGHFGHPSGSSGFKRIEILLHIPGIRQRVLCDILDHRIQCMEAAGLPEDQRLARFRRIDEESWESPRSGNWTTLRQSLPLRLRMTPETIKPRMGWAAEIDLRIRALLSLARTALAIERWRLATGAVPAELAELVPQYLEEVPLDPFDARPVRYRREPTGYTVYSIDTDGHDNGGHEPDPNDPRVPDLCFTVTR